MGIKRIVDTRFWNDNKVVDLFSPEDRYFMLYLLTNSRTTLLGIYEFNKRVMAFELGYSLESVTVLLDRFETKYGIIKISQKTNELAIKNFLKYSIIKGGAPVKDCLVKEIKAVKNKELISYVFSHIRNFEALNETIKKLIDEYEKGNGNVRYVHDTSNDTSNDTTHDTTHNGYGYGYGNGYGNGYENDINIAPSDKIEQEQENIFIKIPLNDNTEFSISTDMVNEFKNLYPIVDIEQELRNYRGWTISNLERRKTKRGIMRSINRWLSNKQDKGNWGYNNPQNKKYNTPSGKDGSEYKMFD